MRRQIKVALVAVTLILSGLSVLTQPEISNSFNQQSQIANK